VLFFNIDFFGFGPRFSRVWGLQVGAKLDVLGFQDPPKSLQNPIFWGDVPKMLPKRAQDGLQEASGIDFGLIFGRFGKGFQSKHAPQNLHIKTIYVLAE